MYCNVTSLMLTFVQVEGREYMLKGMSQQDTKGWQQALATACMLK